MNHIKLFEDYVEEAKLMPGATKIPRKTALAIARRIIEGLGLHYVDPDSVGTDFTFERGIGIPVGSIRRKSPDIGDIDILSTKPVGAADIEKNPWAREITGGEKQVNFVYDDGKEVRRVNIYVFTDPKTFGAALMHVTGSSLYSIRVRNVAKHKGLKLSQHGLFRGDRLVAGPDEASVQRAIGISTRAADDRLR